jgi:hypothetical protein
MCLRQKITVFGFEGTPQDKLKTYECVYIKYCYELIHAVLFCNFEINEVY